MIDREEIVEQVYFFRTLRERMAMNIPMQDALESLRDEVLSTTKLPLAIDFLRSELLHRGTIGTAMALLGHYFTCFQTFVVNEAENDRGRFDLRVGLEILQREAEYRSKAPTPQGEFLYQFETLCRNRLNYDRGLAAIAEDPIYDETWRDWILNVRRQIGIVDICDLMYVRSAHYRNRQARAKCNDAADEIGLLFGEREGKIALANRLKDPLFLLSALQRQLNYPSVPRLKRRPEAEDMVPQLMRRVERLETRLKLMEDEQQQGIDLTQFYGNFGKDNGPDGDG